MKQKKMYGELVFYMEACESGSMFPDPGEKVFAVTAANANESSWATYCTGAVVNGTPIGTCLGDLFSVSWMEDCYMFVNATTTRTIQDQVTAVMERTVRSHVMTFGDTTLAQLPACNFDSSQHRGVVTEPRTQKGDYTTIMARNVPLEMALAGWQQAKTKRERRRFHKEYLSIVRSHAADDDVFSRIVRGACKRWEPRSENLTQCEHRVMTGRAELTPSKWLCHSLLVRSVHETCRKRSKHSAGGWNGYNMKYGSAIVNICEQSDDVHELGSRELVGLTNIVAEECGGPLAHVIV